MQVIATDGDSGSDGAVSYSMATHTYFVVDSDGWVTVKTTPDYDTGGSNAYSFDVVGKDGGSPTPRSASVSVTVRVEDTNDNTAVCSPNVISVQKREDFAGTLASLTCTDADATVNSDLLYVMSSVIPVSAVGDFSVDATGVISVTSLDYETAASYTVSIKVTDQGTPQLSTTVDVTVSLVDVNEFTPLFTAVAYSATVAEKDHPSVAIVIVTATDDDGTDLLRYSLSDTTYMDVDETTGEVFVIVPFDYETVTSQTVDVCVTDSNTMDSTKSSCVSLAVAVSDVNDHDPVFSPAVYTASVDENAANENTVATITATDDDTLASGSTITFSMSSGNSGNVWRVDSTGGQIIVDSNTFLDFETYQSFSLLVTASDGGGRTTQAVVHVLVNPVNEHAPTFTPTTSSVSLPEDNTVGLISSLSALDSDSQSTGDGIVTYRIVSGANSLFNIHPYSGDVSLIGNLDRETSQTHTLLVQADDAGSTPSAFHGQHTLTVNVDDVNDIYPACSLTVYTASIAENSASGSTVHAITCVDNDLDPLGLNNLLAYSLASGNTGSVFSISSTGVVTVFTASIDRETTSLYTLLIDVADSSSGTKLTTSVTMSVFVTDKNDNAPTFATNPIILIVAEDSSLGDTIVTVTSSDPDDGTNGKNRMFFPYALSMSGVPSQSSKDFL